MNEEPGPRSDELTQHPEAFPDVLAQHAHHPQCSQLLSRTTDICCRFRPTLPYGSVTVRYGGRRTVPLPRFAVEMLQRRRTLEYFGQQPVIFPSTAGTLRDPNNFGKEWRKAREELGVPEVTTHSFRKTLATLIDDEGLSARIGADHLDHSKVSMTQDR